jgi:hypothetical protein
LSGNKHQLTLTNSQQEHNQCVADDDDDAIYEDFSEEDEDTIMRSEQTNSQQDGSRVIHDIHSANCKVFFDELWTSIIRFPEGKSIIEHFNLKGWLIRSNRDLGHTIDIQGSQRNCVLCGTTSYHRCTTCNYISLCVNKRWGNTKKQSCYYMTFGIMMWCVVNDTRKRSRERLLIAQYLAIVIIVTIVTKTSDN